MERIFNPDNLTISYIEQSIRKAKALILTPDNKILLCNDPKNGRLYQEMQTVISDYRESLGFRYRR